MSEAVNLKRARLVEFNYGGDILTVTRPSLTDNWTVCAINGRHTALVRAWTTTELLSNSDVRNITVLAESPVTLADLIPEGCTEFRCKTNGAGHLVATKLPSGRWAASSHTSAFPNLDVLAQACRIDLDTVIPLQVHSQYVEERR